MMHLCSTVKSFLSVSGFGYKYTCNAYRTWLFYTDSKFANWLHVCSHANTLHIQWYMYIKRHSKHSTWKCWSNSKCGMKLKLMSYWVLWKPVIVNQWQSFLVVKILNYFLHYMYLQGFLFCKIAFWLPKTL